MAESFHKAANPQLYATTNREEERWTSVTDLPDHLKTQVTFEPPQESPEELKKKALQEISTCPTLPDLRSYKTYAANDKELYAAYNQRVKELAG